MSLPKKLLLRILGYVVVMGYMYCDFFIFRGPLSRMVNPDEMNSKEKIAAAKAEGIVARAYFQPIYRTQVEERMREHLWRRGLNEPSGDVKILREAVLADLIDELLIKIQIKVSGRNDYAVSEEEKEAALARFNARFESEEARDLLMEKQGWQGGEKELKMRLAARIQRERYLENQLTLFNQEYASETPSSWYEKNKAAFQNAHGEVPEFSEVEDRVTDALEVIQRKKGIGHFRKILRLKAKGKIQIFRDVLHAEDLE